MYTNQPNLKTTELWEKVSSLMMFRLSQSLQESDYFVKREIAKHPMPLDVPLLVDEQKVRMLATHRTAAFRHEMVLVGVPPPLAMLHFLPSSRSTFLMNWASNSSAILTLHWPQKTKVTLCSSNSSSHAPRHLGASQFLELHQSLRQT
jgi:hypothetical protein